MNVDKVNCKIGTLKFTNFFYGNVNIQEDYYVQKMFVNKILTVVILKKVIITSCSYIVLAKVKH